jgi:hypothetical protein
MHVRLRFRCTVSTNTHNTSRGDGQKSSNSESQWTIMFLVRWCKAYNTFTFYLSPHYVTVFHPPLTSLCLVQIPFSERYRPTHILNLLFPYSDWPNTRQFQRAPQTNDLLQKLTVAQMVNNSSHLTYPNNSWTCNNPNTRSHAEPYESSPLPRTSFSNIHFNVIDPSTSRPLKRSLSFTFSDCK